MKTLKDLIGEFGFKFIKESVDINLSGVNQIDMTNHSDESILSSTELIFQDENLAELIYDKIIDVQDYEDEVFTYQDAFEFDDYLLGDGYNDSWFVDNENIVSFSELQYFRQIDNIPDYCFRGMKSLESISFPLNIECINIGAFIHCKSLKNINLSSLSKLTYIGTVAFADTDLETVQIPEGVKEIGDYAFSDCSNLKHVILPSTIEKIGDGAFSDCPKLETVLNIQMVKHLGEDVFGGSLGFTQKNPQFQTKYFHKKQILFDGSWIYTDEAETYFLEEYLYRRYDAESLDQVKDCLYWQEDEFNPQSENFVGDISSSSLFWEYMNDYLEMEFQDLQSNLKYSKVAEKYEWIDEDGDTYSEIWDGIYSLMSRDGSWGDVKIFQVEDGTIYVDGETLYPLCKRDGLGEEKEDFGYFSGYPFDFQASKRMYSSRLKEALF